MRRHACPRMIATVAMAVLAVVASGCGADDEDDADAAAEDARAIDAQIIDAAVDAAPRAAVLIACNEANGIVRHTAEVTDAVMGYVPTGNATIPVGHAVKWANAGGGVPHSITSGRGGATPAPDGLFDSGVFTEHGTFICVRFDAPGRYPYHCSVHPNSAEQAEIKVGGP